MQRVVGALAAGRVSSPIIAQRHLDHRVFTLPVGVGQSQQQELAHGFALGRGQRVEATPPSASAWGVPHLPNSGINAQITIRIVNVGRLPAHVLENVFQ